MNKDDYIRKYVPDMPIDEYLEKEIFDEKAISERAELPEADPMIREAMEKEASDWEMTHELHDPSTLYSGSGTKMEIAELEDNIRTLVQEGRYSYRALEDYLISLRYNIKDIREAFKRVTGVSPMKYLSKLKIFENSPKEIPPVTLGWGKSKNKKTDYYFIMPHISGYQIIGQKGDIERFEEDFFNNYEEALNALKKKTKKVEIREPQVDEDIRENEDIQHTLIGPIKNKRDEFKDISDFEKQSSQKKENNADTVDLATPDHQLGDRNTRDFNDLKKSRLIKEIRSIGPDKYKVLFETEQDLEGIKKDKLIELLETQEDIDKDEILEEIENKGVKKFTYMKNAMNKKDVKIFYDKIIEMNGDGIVKVIENGEEYSPNEWLERFVVDLTDNVPEFSEGNTSIYFQRGSLGWDILVDILPEYEEEKEVVENFIDEYYNFEFIDVSDDDGNNKKSWLSNRISNFNKFYILYSLNNMKSEKYFSDLNNAKDFIEDKKENSNNFKYTLFKLKPGFSKVYIDPEYYEVLDTNEKYYKNWHESTQKKENMSKNDKNVNSNDLEIGDNVKYDVNNLGNPEWIGKIIDENDNFYDIAIIEVQDGNGELVVLREPYPKDAIKKTDPWLRKISSKKQSSQKKEAARPPKPTSPAATGYKWVFDEEANTWKQVPEDTETINVDPASKKEDILKGDEAEKVLKEILDNEDDGGFLKPYISGYFYDEEDNKWFAFDNTTGNCWVEEFDKKQNAIDWIKGDFEMSEFYEKSSQKRRASNNYTIGIYTNVQSDLNSILEEYGEPKNTSGGALGFPHKFVEINQNEVYDFVDYLYDINYNVFKPDMFDDMLIIYPKDEDKVKNLYKKFISEEEDLHFSAFEDYLFENDVEPVGFIIQNP